MRLIRGIHNLAECHRGTVVTIGNFDGVHLGHQQIIQQVCAEARVRGLQSTVMLFEPQPAEFFAPESAPARIMTLRDKLEALAACGVDQVLCARFDRQFQQQSADAFIQHLLIDGLGVEYLVIGDDFRFGADRSGDFVRLQQAGLQSGFSVTDTPTCELDGERVSSSRIREALAQGELAFAEKMLGSPFSISGRVKHGDKIGRTINVPTANISLNRLHCPVSGIYAVRVSGAGMQRQPAVANVGTRPTVNGTENRLEVHLLDREQDLYGQRLNVEFEYFVRPEAHFDGLEQLKEAIQEDIAQARVFFEAR